MAIAQRLEHPRAMEDAVLWSDRLPYLAPHLQLLMKSKNTRPKDDNGAQVVIPRLASADRQWLTTHLADDHPWQAVANEQLTDG